MSYRITHLRPLAALLLLCLLSTPATAQFGRKKAKEEKVAVSCDIPRDQRNIVAVRSFRTTANGRNVNSIGNGMADMLTNALINSECFRVVDRQTLEDILDEQDFTNGGRVSQSSSAKLGELTGAQLLVTGNVTEFKENEGGVGGVLLSSVVPVGGLGMVKAHIGFIIQIIDVNTGEILVSKSIERKKNKVGGLTGAGGGGIYGGVGFFKSQAMADCLEEAIIESIAILAEEREDLPPPRKVEKLEGRMSAVVIEGMSYTDLRKVASMAEGFPDVFDVDKRVEDGNGVLEIRHGGDLEDILDALLDKSGFSLEVVDMSDDLIRLRM